MVAEAQDGIKVPIEVISADDLTPQQKVIYTYLLGQAAKGNFSPSALDIAAGIGGTHVGVISRAIRRLEKKGWIVTKRGSGGLARTTNTYTLRGPVV